MLKESSYAIISGTFASVASIFGKLSGAAILEEWIVLRALCFSAMLLCNGCVWTFFVKALQASSSSLNATIISASTNYLISAIFGFLIFGEVTSLLWWSGMCLVIVGLILLVGDQSDAKKKLK